MTPSDREFADKLIDLAESRAETATKNLTDMGNARRFAARYQDDVRYVQSWGWLCWNGKIWEHDKTGTVQRKAKAVVMSLYAEVADVEDPDGRKAVSKHAMKSEAAAAINNMIELAKSEIELVATPEEFDRNPFLFNVTTGTINLKTGELQKHNPADMLTKIAPVIYNPKAKSPLFEKFLNRIMAGNVSLVKYQQKLIGYALSGSTQEQSIHLHQGQGGNGKSVLINTYKNIFGDYAIQAQAETFEIKNNNGIPNDIARLAGSRLVIVQETQTGKRLNEALIKSATGGDTLVGRFLHKEFFEFIPAFKIFLITNHRPVIKGQDYAIWRRMHLIPYSVTIPLSEQDKGLERKLKAEFSGILNWAIEGCLLWQQEGLGLPEEVQSATSDYRAEQADTVHNFIIDSCKQDVDGRIPAKELYESYQEWCNKNSEEPAGQRSFKRKVQDLGFKQKRTGKNGSREWHKLRFIDGTDGTTTDSILFSIYPSHENIYENEVSPSVASESNNEPPVLEGN